MGFHQLPLNWSQARDLVKLSVSLFLWVKQSHFQILLSLVPLGSRIWLREWGRGGSLTWQVGHREPSSGGWEAGHSFFRLVFDVTTGLPSASQRFAGAVPAPLDEKGWLSGGHLPWGAEWGEGSLTDSVTHSASPHHEGKSLSGF